MTVYELTQRLLEMCPGDPAFTPVIVRDDRTQTFFEIDPQLTAERDPWIEGGASRVFLDLRPLPSPAPIVNVIVGPTPEFIVTKHAERARANGHCLYCQAATGTPHKADCVCIVRPVKLRVTIEYEAEEYVGFDKDGIEFRRNEGSWCASNLLDELHTLGEKEGCLCGVASFEYLGDAGPPRLRE